MKPCAPRRGDATGAGGGGCAGPRRADASAPASRGRQRRRRTWAGAAALAAAAVAVGLAAALPPGESGHDLLSPLPAHQGAPHAGWPGGPAAFPGLLPEAHAFHPAPVRCDTTVLDSFFSPQQPISLRFLQPNGTYGIGDTIDIRVAPVASGQKISTLSPDNPSHWLPTTILEMETGEIDRNAVFAGPALGGPINYVDYRYTVQEGDNSTDLDYKQRTSLYWRSPGAYFGYLSEHRVGGTSEVFNCYLPVPGTAGSLSYQSDIVVDGIRPNVTSVSAAMPNGTYGQGSKISVNVTFSEPVFFGGSAEPPSLALDLGWTDRRAAYAGGNGTAALVFNYTLRAGDHAPRLAYNATNALTAAGLEDIAGNAANLTLFAPGAPGSLSNSSRLEADTPPGVESVSSPNATGVYGIGETVRVNVTFTRPVAVDTAGGSPTLGIEAGGPGRSAAYVPGSASGRSMLFEYAVGPGDWGVLNASSLSLNGATVEGPDGRAAGTALPGPAGGGGGGGGAPLSSAAGAGPPILVDHAKPSLIHVPMGTAAAAGASSVVALEANGTRYVLAGGSGAVHLARVHENGTLGAVRSLAHGGGVTLRQVDGIDAFRMGNATWAVAAARNDNAMQTIRVHDNGTLEGVDSLSAGTPLSAPWDVAAFEMGAENDAYALATSGASDTVQLARVHSNGTLDPAGNLHRTPSNFDYPIRADVFRTDNGSVRALVTAYNDDRVHLFRVNETGLAHLATAADNAEGGAFPVLDGPSPLASFGLGGERHALVGAFGTDDDGLQLIRVANGDSLEEAGSARDDSNGGIFDALDRVRAIAAFNVGSATYAAAASGDEDGIQLVRVRAGGGDGALVPAGSAKDDSMDTGSPFTSLENPHGIDTFELGGRMYAAVASKDSSAVTLVRLSPASVVSVSSPNATGPHAAGAQILVNVAFGDPVDFGEDPPRLLLDVAGSPRNATYLSGNTTSSLAFNYTVRDGDNGVLGYRAVDSLSGNVRDLGGPRADTTLPAPGSSGSLSDSAVGLDTRSPLVLSVSSNASGTYGIGGTIHASVQFGERVEVDDAGGLPVLALRVGAAVRNASYSFGSGTDTLLFAYDVREGDASASLDYADRSALALNGSAITDAAANNAVLRLAEPGGSILGAGAAIAVDGVRPEAESVSSPDKPGLYGIGRTIRVDVNFTTPVTVAGGGQPFVALATGGESNGSAAYASGSGTATLRFEYDVREGDSAPRLDYAGRSALVLNGSAIRDGAGNGARTTLPEPSGSLLAGGAFIEADGVRPEAESVWSPNRTATTYYTNQRVHVNVNFSEAVTVGAGGSPPPSIALNAGDGARAAYASGNGTGTLAFVYDVRPDDSADALDYANGSELDLGGASIRDAAGNDANTALPAPGPQGSPLAAARIAVDGTVVSVASVTSPDADGAYGAGSRVNITVTFTEAVDVSSGATPPPSIALNAGEGARAAYDSGGGTGTLLFAYEVRPGDSAGRLAYAGGSALSPGGAAIAATDGGAPAHLDLPAPGRDASLSGSKAIAIDTAPPAVERVFSPNRTDTYRIGAAIHVVAEFDEAVSVAGEPRIPLDAGGGEGAAATAASYASGSGTASLLFLYTVAAGDFSADLDYAPGSSIVLPGGASIRDAAGNDAGLALPAPGGGSSLGDTSAIFVRGTSEPLDASASAVFAGPNTVRIDYDAPLGPSPAREGPAYGAVTAGGPAAPAVSESGLGTRTHTVVFGGDGVDAGQSGTIRLLASLEGEVDGIVPYAFPAGDIPVAAGETARTLSPPGASPAAAIESNGFVRALNATAAGDTARPAINVTGLPAPGGGGTLPAPGAGAINATLPADGRVAVIASFAEVSFPPGVEARGVPADGLIELYVAARAPTAQEVADGLGVDAADVLEVRRAVEVGDDAARIEFSLPVRILLVGQADGRAFYVGAAAGGAAAAAAVSPIRAECKADDTGTVHAQLDRSGACWIESGGDMVIYTYHMTRFGTARLAEFADAASMCAAVLSPPAVAFGAVEAGGQSAAAAQTITRAGSVPLAAVSVGASAWTGADGAVAMPANATSVMDTGAGAPAAWTPLGGAPVPLQVDTAGRSAAAEFRVDVPQGALPGGASSPAGVSQTVTYTVSCARPSG